MIDDDRPSPMAESSEPAAGPWLGVHVLTEFLYCPRAGLVAFESDRDDDGEEWGIAKLDYLPLYDARRMRQELNRSFTQLWRLVALLITVLLLMWQLRGLGIFILVPGLWGMGAVTRSLFATISTISELGQELQRAESAVPRIPDPAAGDRQRVNWWELLQGGFISKLYDEPLPDEAWKMTGRPWRVLANGDLRIPVFRQHHQSGIYPQHLARIAAYCHLIEVRTGMQSPYGIVLFGNTREGVTIAKSPSAHRLWQQGLISARNVIRQSQQENSEPAPPRAAFCENCPIGRPVLVESPLPENVFLLRGADRRKYHSPCGDRFQWLPPHQRVQELKLQPVRKK